MLKQGEGNLLGPSLLIVGTFLFSIQDVIMKTLGLRGYSLPELTFFRSISAISALLVIMFAARQPIAFVPRDIGILIARSLIQLVSYVCYFLGIASLPYGNAVALSVTSPIWLVIFGAALFGEPLGVFKVACVVAGFFGALLIAVPDSGVFQWGALFMLFSAVTYAMQQLLARRIGARNGASVIVLAMYLTMLTVSSLAGLIYPDGFETGEFHVITFVSRPWIHFTGIDLLLILSCGVIHALGSISMVRGYVIGPASVVAPFEYAALLWAAAWGAVLWGEVPTLQASIGIVVIGAMGILLARNIGSPRSSAHHKGS